MWTKTIARCGKVETVECKEHSYAWSGKIPCTGVRQCIYCGKPADEAMVERLKRQKEIAKEIITELSDNAKWFGEVMAIMHADGGHYLAQHGPEKSAKDAVAKYHRLIQELQEARPVPKSAPKENAEAQKHLTTGQS